MISVKKIIVVLVGCVLLVHSATPAIGAGGKYEDAQKQLSYSVYKPSKTLGLGNKLFSLIPCGDEVEPWLYAKYGGSVRYFEIMETMVGAKCSDPGESKELRDVKINGIAAKLHVFCDPMEPTTFTKCTTAEITRRGGYLIFTNKASKGLKRTKIQVQVFGGITYAQLLTIAKSLKTV